MPDFNHIKEICSSNSALTADVVDKFLLYYAAQENKTDKEFEKRLKRFNHVLSKFPTEFVGLIKAQYIAHRVFRQEGLINRYLKHASLKNLNAAQREYLEMTVSNPWRFSFCKIIANPSPDFYEMSDIYRETTYLLYSPSVSKTLAEHPVSVWFNLIGFNGTCWQTFGPVSFYQSFDADDIFFFATELNDHISSDEELLDDLDNNPVPYMMLSVGSTYPHIRHGDFETIQVSGVTDTYIRDFHTLKQDFTVFYSTGVYKLVHNEWSKPPHFAEAFYDEDKYILTLQALSEFGYKKVASILKVYDLSIPNEPDIRIHPSMLTSIRQLLKKSMDFNKYGKLFEQTPSLKENDELGKLNKVLTLALPFINAGKEPDIDAIAKKAGVPVELAQDLIRHSMERIKELIKR